MRISTRLLAATATALLVGAIVALSASVAYGADPPDIPITTVVRGEPGSVHVLETEAVDPGQDCKVTATGRNGESRHPNSDLLISSGKDSVVVPDVEHTSNFTTTAAGTLTTGDMLTVAIRLGADGKFSGGVTVSLDCTPPPPPTTTVTVPPPPPVVTTTTAPPTVTTLPPPPVTTTPPPACDPATDPACHHLPDTGPGKYVGAAAWTALGMIFAGTLIGLIVGQRRRRA